MRPLFCQRPESSNKLTGVPKHNSIKKLNDYMKYILKRKIFQVIRFLSLLAVCLTIPKTAAYSNERLMSLSFSKDEKIDFVLNNSQDARYQRFRIMSEMPLNLNNLILLESNINAKRYKSKLPYEENASSPYTISINVLTPGTLRNVILSMGIELNKINSLIVKGKIDARDFKTIRDEMINTVVLDCSEVQIAAYQGKEGTDTLGLSRTYPKNSIPQFCFWNPNSQSTRNWNTILIPTNVEYIGEYAFTGCAELTNFFLPKSVVSIGANAFNYCLALTSISFPSTLVNIGESAFLMSGLKYIDIPTNVLKMGDTAFEGCSNLTSAKISSLVIGEYAFLNCTSLTTVDISNSVNNIGERAFSGCVNLTTAKIHADTIGRAAFNGCSKLNSVSIINVKYIDDAAFANCIGLLQIYIPFSVKYMYRAFWGCSRLNYVSIASKSTGLFTFFNCKSLTAVDLDLSVTEIGDASFSGCSALKTIKIPEAIDTIGFEAFYGCSGLTQITIPYSVKKIYNGAFIGSGSISVDSRNSDYSSLNGLLFNKNRSILHYCPASISGNLSIPSTVVVVDNRAFYGCDKLTAITLSFFTSYIGSFAFKLCNKLVKVNCPAITPPELGDDVFTDINMPNCLLIIPEGSLNSYSSAEQWNSFEKVSCLVLHKELELKSAGTLSDVLNEDERENLLYLSISGNIDVRDFAIIRDYISNLSFLDLSESTVVSYRGVIDPSVDTVSYSEHSIPKNGFNNMRSLMLIDLPKNLIEIDTLAFSGCVSLCSITIPEHIDKIGKEAFKGCSNLQEMYYNATNCSSMGESYYDNVIGDCVALSKIIIGENVKSIPAYAFYGCYGIKNIEVPDNVESIGMRAFMYCEYLKSVRLSSSLKLLEKELFCYCYSLDSIIIPTSVQEIKSHVFQDSPLKTITIPASVTSLGSGAFNGCDKLESVYVESKTPIKLSSNGISEVFEKDKSNCILYVPAGSKALYAVAYEWKDFANIIEYIVSSIHHPDDGTIKVFYNPLTKTLQIQGIDNMQLQVAIYNLNGTLCISGKINQYEEGLLVNLLPKGGYIVKVDAANNNFITKLMIQ